MEESITFVSGGNHLEGRLFPASSERAVAITHPHPLMGGDMESGVVVRIAKVYQEAGWATLRFNFRGTGRSQGRYDEGIGEQADLQAAIAFLETRGYARIDLAGYSFGAWIIARWAQGAPSHGRRILLVAPPLDFLEFTSAPITGLAHVIAGDRDSYGSPDRIARMLPAWNSGAALNVVPEADHFFSYQAARLSEALRSAVNDSKIKS